MSTDAEQLGSLVSVPSEGGEPRSSSSSDRRSDSNRLDVGNRRRATEQSNVGRERGLESRLALLALNRLDKGSLFSTDVLSR